MRRILIFAFCMALLAFPLVSYADGNETQQGEIVVISAVETPTPEPAPAPPATPEPVQRNYHEYPWTQDDIDTTAQVYWVWCNTSQEKADMTALIVNRVMSGLTKKDGSRMFPENVENVVTQSGEFNISKARCSDRNRDLARVNLNKCMTEWMVGDAGVRVPKTAIYVDRVDGVLTMYDSSWDVVWRCSEK